MHATRRRVPALLPALALLVAAVLAWGLTGCGDTTGSDAAAAPEATAPTAAPGGTVVPSTTTTAAVSTTTTVAPTTTTTTESPLVPLVLSGHEQAEVGTVSVVVNDIYPRMEGDVELGLAGLVVDALASMGVVGIEGGLGSDAALIFEVQGRALSSRYTGDAGRFTAYSGAAYTGVAEFSVAGLESRRWDVSGRLDPLPEVFGPYYANPTDAPFPAAFLMPVLDSFSRIWGPAVAIQTIGVWPEFDRAAVGAWVAGIAAEVMPRLMEMRLSGSFDVSMPAYDALAQIVVRRAVPAQERSRIVRALIADMDGPYHYAGQALGLIAWRGGSGSHGSEDGMTYVGPWEPEIWAAWADAHGY